MLHLLYGRLGEWAWQVPGGPGPGPGGPGPGHGPLGEWSWLIPVTMLVIVIVAIVVVVVVVVRILRSSPRSSSAQRSGHPGPQGGDDPTVPR